MPRWALYPMSCPSSLFYQQSGISPCSAPSLENADTVALTSLTDGIALFATGNILSCILARISDGPEQGTPHSTSM